MSAALLQLTPHLDAGDPGRDALDLARHLRSRGGRPVVASSGGVPLREFAGSGVTHLQVPLARTGLLARWHSSARIARAIREHRLDAVHAHTAALAPIAAAAARSTSIPYVVTIREDNPPEAALDALRRADRVIAVSEFVAKRIAATLSQPPGIRLQVVRRWIDLAEFDPERVRGYRVSALAERWGITPGSRVLLVPTLPADDRGHLVLLQAMARLPRTDFVTLFGGGLEPDSRYGMEVLSAVRRAGLAERVRFAVASDDLAATIALADIVALPATHPDPTGFLAVAAQAMGRPVIVSNRGALPEAVMPAATGWMVKAGDAGELAAALGLALEMAAEPRRRLAARARAFVKDEFGLAINADRILAIYRGLGGTPLARAG